MPRAAARVARSPRSLQEKRISYYGKDIMTTNTNASNDAQLTEDQYWDQMFQERQNFEHTNILNIR